MVIDINSRRPRADQPLTDEQRAQQFAEGCADRVLVEALKMRAINGLDAELRMLGKVAEDLRNQGRNE